MGGNNRTSNVFSMQAQELKMREVTKQADAERDEAIAQSARIRMDRSAEVRQFFSNGYCKSMLRELKQKRGELRGLLSSGSGESIGRFQVLDEWLEKLQVDELKARR